MGIMNVSLRKYRREFLHSYAFGISPTLELLRRRPGAAMGVIASARSDRSETTREIRRLCHDLGMAFRIDDVGLERLGCRESCVVAGVFRKYVDLLDPTANHVMLDRPQYHGNIGTIARTMAGFGFTDLAVIRPAAEVLDPECIRSSMGAAFAVRCQYFDSFGVYQQIHRRTVYPFVVEGGEAPEAITFRSPLSLLFGNEGAGLSKSQCRSWQCVSIPHAADIDSLNVAVAVGIALYELSRRMPRNPCMM